jgi:hypothetical protein
MMCPLPILPFSNDTITHNKARIRKNGACEGTYSRNPAGLSKVTTKYDRARMSMSRKRL